MPRKKRFGGEHIGKSALSTRPPRVLPPPKFSRVSIEQIRGLNEDDINILKLHQIYYTTDIQNISPEELLKIEGITPKTVYRLYKAAGMKISLSKLQRIYQRIRERRAKEVKVTLGIPKVAAVEVTERTQEV